MRVSDGVLDVVGSCRRSATQNCLLNQGIIRSFGGGVKLKRAERIGKDKRNYEKNGLLRLMFQSCEFCYFLSEESNRSPHFTWPRRSFFKSRLQLNHVPVHETHSAKVRQITTTSKTPSLTRIVGIRVSSEFAAVISSDCLY